LMDGRWYERCEAAIAADPELASRSAAGDGAPASAALAALARHRDLPLWFDTQNELQALRALTIAQEADRDAVLVGSGMEFRRLAALAGAGTAIVVPLEFPAAPAIDSAAAAGNLALRQLQSWEQAPTNSARLHRAGVEFAWTTARLDDKKAFRTNLERAIRCGVPPEVALAALTTVPAKLLGIDSVLGTIAPGKLANLTVVDGDLFDPEAKIRAVWVGGREHEVTPVQGGLDGEWQLAEWSERGEAAQATLKIDAKKVELRVGEDKITVALGTRDADAIACRAMDLFGKGTGVCFLRLHRVGDALAGTLTRSSGQDRAIRATRVAAATGADGKPNSERSRYEPPPLDPLPTPLGGYGAPALPPPQDFAIVGATLWPCDGSGIVANGAVVVRDGRIVFAGPSANMPQLGGGTVEIDGSGKHVTPGIIDCHSHTGISGGINEGGQAVTAECRVADVIDPDDVNWYRQLAGGVTAVNQLHGSANAIGGQSSTVKLRYGVAHPDEMRFADAPAGMKWALGENPRRTNGQREQTRYPSTRMGVEALIRDRLVAAETYRREHRAYDALPPRERARVLPPRRDLELEAIAEIIAGERRIHCHSYRQDEIFMLCGIAQEYGFKIGTFQHVLEGYKVADAIAANAVGASSFSDWWAYKFEVYDAIPENGAILHEAGVSVSFNSDSNEHARRLNTEAGKAVKYGGVAPAEALCFVTRNPAVQLGIFDRTGSLSAGKDADIALWSANPLSYASRCEATWVDGRPMFSLARDRELRQQIAAERARLLAAIAAAGKPGRGKESTDKDARDDAYWAAEYLDEAYCCRTHAVGGGR
ncbi:MAG: amidohydrolase family protein, partial [Planctomycetes bacterium]|nr:amidohydrolase family protein [Planctomycetota bacterium]